MAQGTIKEARRARNRGDGEALDGHALLAQLKTAAALGILDGRYEVKDEDWELASTIVRKSAETRASVVATLRAKAREANHARGEAEANRTIQVQARVTDAAVRRICGVIVRKLGREKDWVSAGALRGALASSDRGHFGTAIELLLETGHVDSQNVNRHGSGHGGQGTQYRLNPERS